LLLTIAVAIFDEVADVGSRVAVLKELAVSLEGRRLLFVYGERAGSKVPPALQYICRVMTRVACAEQLGDLDRWRKANQRLKMETLQLCLIS
jgi:hypothetical protein